MKQPRHNYGIFSLPLRKCGRFRIRSLCRTYQITNFPITCDVDLGWMKPWRKLLSSNLTVEMSELGFSFPTSTPLEGIEVTSLVPDIFEPPQGITNHQVIHAKTKYHTRSFKHANKTLLVYVHTPLPHTIEKFNLTYTKAVVSFSTKHKRRDKLQ